MTIHFNRAELRDENDWDALIICLKEQCEGGLRIEDGDSIIYRPTSTEDAAKFIEVCGQFNPRYY